ncbi:hypothetical protein J6TS2_53020 [Heyndrickxia sporothermodurans]|nr:hypothetical protein J6TS2_53020 [Heyndrickxia sporothermodurans]
MVHTIVTGPHPSHPGACIEKHYYNSYVNHNNPGNEQSTVSSGLLSDISKAIIGEYQAIYCYDILIQQTSNNKLKKQIFEIKNDEIRHFQTFSQIFTSLTNKQPIVQLTKKCPSNFKSGLVSAFIDEQETVDFYHEIARKTSNNYIKEQFQQAAFDEQNHAVWFLYFMNHTN